MVIIRDHQTRRSGQLFRLGFNEIAQFLSKSEVLVALISLFKTVFFSPIIILFLQYSRKRSSHVPEIWPIQGLMVNILFQFVNCILFKIIVQHVRFVRKETFKISIDFQKSPRFSLTSPLSQLREKSSRPVFTMCGEPWIIIFSKCVYYDEMQKQMNIKNVWVDFFF
jgi:hypothetical protein